MDRWILIVCTVACTVEGNQTSLLNYTRSLTLFLEGQSISRTQDLPGANSLDVRPEFFEDITDVSLIVDAAEAYVATACPSGIQKCECMNAPGMEISLSFLNEKSFDALVLLIKINTEKFF